MNHQIRFILQLINLNQMLASIKGLREVRYKIASAVKLDFVRIVCFTCVFVCATENSDRK